MAWGANPFKFEDTLSEHHLFRKYFEDWSGNKSLVMKKLSYARKKLIIWNKEVFGNVKFEKQVLENPRVDKFDGEGMLDESLNRE